MLTPWVTRLIIANVIMFVLQKTAPQIEAMLMFIPALGLLRPWTVITYMFLHGDIGHILFNMLGLFFFGPRLEIELGTKQFLILYFLSGITGALLSVILSPMAALIGASAGVYGVFLGFAYFWPRAQIYIWGVFPVEARWLVVIMTVLSRVGGFGGSSDGTAHFAHLGGFVGGFVYLKWFVKKQQFVTTPITPSAPVPTSTDIQRWSGIRREGMHPVNREELDRIMGKLRTSGAGSLTSTEIAFLDRFSANQ